MDCRVTLNKNEIFIDLLEGLAKSKSNVSFLIDVEGFVRAEGFIKRIHKDADSCSIELTSGIEIPLESIVAVNGVFLPEYAEC